MWHYDQRGASIEEDDHGVATGRLLFRELLL